LVVQIFETSAMTISHTPAELSTLLGSSIRTLRIDRNLKQVELAAQAGISLHALQNLESGEGATVRTLVTVLRALGREEWLKNLAPSPTINPLNLPRGASERKRARKSRHAG
jgi:transcriptional regulator with XRE-family HTH domain